MGRIPDCSTSNDGQSGMCRQEQEQQLQALLKQLAGASQPPLARPLPLSDDDKAIAVAAQWLREAKTLLVGTGAGMAVDSGLGTYRGRHAGVWPPLEKLNMDYTDICHPDVIVNDAQLGWAFWHHCANSYRSSEPHEGYHIIKRWGERASEGYFCYTSNVDGLWARVVPEDRLYEVHGSTAYVQCSVGRSTCSNPGHIWPYSQDAPSLQPSADADYLCPEGLVPRCSSCNAVARPNVLMFGDDGFCRRRARTQGARYKQWLAERAELVPDSSRMVCLEVGAGRAVPTVRTTLEHISKRHGCRLIRINPDDHDLPAWIGDDERGVSIKMGALLALQRINSCIEASTTQT